MPGRSRSRRTTSRSLDHSPSRPVPKACATWCATAFPAGRPRRRCSRSRLSPDEFELSLLGDERALIAAAEEAIASGIIELISEPGVAHRSRTSSSAGALRAAVERAVGPSCISASEKRSSERTRTTSIASSTILRITSRSRRLSAASTARSSTTSALRRPRSGRSPSTMQQRGSPRRSTSVLPTRTAGAHSARLGDRSDPRRPGRGGGAETRRGDGGCAPRRGRWSSLPCDDHPPPRSTPHRRHSRER